MFLFHVCARLCSLPCCLPLVQLSRAQQHLSDVKNQASFEVRQQCAQVAEMQSRVDKYRADIHAVHVQRITELATLAQQLCVKEQEVNARLQLENDSHTASAEDGVAAWDTAVSTPEPPPMWHSPPSGNGSTVVSPAHVLGGDVVHAVTASASPVSHHTAALAGASVQGAPSPSNVPVARSLFEAFGPDSDTAMLESLMQQLRTRDEELFQAQSALARMMAGVNGTGHRTDTGVKHAHDGAAAREDEEPPTPSASHGVAHSDNPSTTASATAPYSSPVFVNQNSLFLKPMTVAEAAAKQQQAHPSFTSPPPWGDSHRSTSPLPLYVPE